MAVAGTLGGGGLAGLDLTGGGLPLAAFRDSASTTTTSVTSTGSDRKELTARHWNVSALTTALTKYAGTVPEFSVAVLDKKTGQRYSFRGSETYETASVVKVQVLACLLLTAQDHRRHLSATEVSLAKRMIRLSDNDATTALFQQLGRDSGVQSCDRRLGLTHTTVSSSWGLTRTTVDDQVKLLSHLVSKGGPLDEGSRDFAYALLSTVDKAQAWGVPAAAGPGEKVIVKNGWLARSTEDNRWIVNSVGRITGTRTDVSIAVLSHGHRSMSGGVTVVQTVAKLTRRHLAY